MERLKALAEKKDALKEKVLQKKEDLIGTSNEAKNENRIKTLDNIFEKYENGVKRISESELNKYLRARVEALKNASSSLYFRDLKQKGQELNDRKYEIFSSCIKDSVERLGLYMNLEDSVESIMLRYNYRRKQPLILGYAGFDSLFVGLFAKKIMGYSAITTLALSATTFGVIYLGATYKYKRDIRLFNERMTEKYLNYRKDLTFSEESVKLNELIEKTSELISDENDKV